MQGVLFYQLSSSFSDGSYLRKRIPKGGRVRLSEWGAAMQGDRFALETAEVAVG